MNKCKTYKQQLHIWCRSKVNRLRWVSTVVTHRTAVTSSCLLISTVNSCSASSSSSDSSICNTKVMISTSLQHLLSSVKGSQSGLFCSPNTQFNVQFIMHECDHETLHRTPVMWPTMLVVIRILAANRERRHPVYRQTNQSIVYLYLKGTETIYI